MKESTRRRKDAAKTKRAKTGARKLKSTGPLPTQPKGDGVYRTADGSWHVGPTGSG